MGYYYTQKKFNNWLIGSKVDYLATLINHYDIIKQLFIFIHSLLTWTFTNIESTSLND